MTPNPVNTVRNDGFIYKYVNRQTKDKCQFQARLKEQEMVPG